MATSTPTSTTEPFPALEITPHTPTSLSSAQPTTLPTINELTETPASPRTQLPSLTALDKSPKLDRSRFSPAPVAFTGAAALADAKRKRQQDSQSSRQTTLNPAVETVHALMAGSAGMSRPVDAPNAVKLSEPLKKVAEKIVIPENNNITTDAMQTSPVSVSSFGTLDGANGHASALTATTASTTSTVPPYLTEPADTIGSQARSAQQQEESNKAFSYPGPPAHAQQQSQDTPARGMSLSGLEYGDSAKSSPASGSKRHKCPYCSTDFTRHHNLKSHLLTHSQEKPYVCHTCQARFRRLHDLKRHAKLHTGERPHTCEKCGRSFARGDALARHNKGPGGCAGRRSSFGGDDNGDGTDVMDGIEYGADDDGEDSAADGQSRRVSEPSRKRVQVETPHDLNRSVYRQHSSTYPPLHRLGDMGPPAIVHNNSNNQATSPRDVPNAHNAANPPSYYPGFSQHTGGMTESPKPLSPGQPPESNRLSIDAGPSGTRNRSPSLTTQFQQTHFGRGGGGRTPPQPGQFQGANQLPPLSLSTSLTRPPLHSNLSGPGPSTLHHQSVPSTHNASNPASASSQGQSSGSSMRDILAGGGPGSGGGDADLWAHVRQLEGRFSRMQDEYELRISRLQEEVISLRGQLNVVASNAQQGQYPPEPSRY